MSTAGRGKPSSDRRVATTVAPGQAPTCEEVQPLERERPGKVHVVEDERQPSAWMPAGRARHVGRRTATPALTSWSTRAHRRSSGSQATQERCQYVALGAEQRSGVVGLETAEVQIEGVHHGLEGQAAGQLLELATQYHRAGGAGARGPCVEQPGLAHAGLALHRHQATPAQARGRAR